ncbi:putative TIR domain, winged helix-turn-helix DNA-binding domain-containing protein [Medicago truncatula]|uniref:Disease resistance protein (TIR-NBS-LRR class) n=1 Tax=Medicago truncatula TaxID=3880 RepID=A0A072UH39_MEDTR|nr:TMV resistance protein N isoform X2 [Medicago truncatula]KEH25115.1 disease resistance protein (TIR-NBS-LRR class) [Medicago truncatula]RHN50229.1 putative TIR domain, winged helix-turn-helix DNA-binding domain-containing protein [Medicago truncatula]
MIIICFALTISFILYCHFLIQQMVKENDSKTIGDSLSPNNPTSDHYFSSVFELIPDLELESEPKRLFLNFSEEDALSSFTSHLLAALQKFRITVFTYDNVLQRGDHISTSLSSAIGESKIFIIVFSKNYANSRRCLDELEIIVNCGRTIGEVVVPVFYHVAPTEVRYQKGEFGISFQSFLNKTSNKVELELSWRAALRRAASIAGFLILNSRNESEDIKRIVDRVVHLFSLKPSSSTPMPSISTGEQSIEQEAFRRSRHGRKPILRLDPTSNSVVLDPNPNPVSNPESDPVLDPVVSDPKSDPDPESKLKPERVRIHDVFLSFRGEDTRSSFTSHLYAALKNFGIKVFRDDNELQRGDCISTSLSHAIEQSRISIIVFSKNYADSRWCLNELEKIMKCQRTIGQVVVPVFYHVDPSEVRNQKGEFGRAFESLLNRILNEVELALNWKEALRVAAGLAGFVVLNFRNESDAINDIVENISRLLDKTDLFIANYPVGVESRVRDVIQLLDIQRPNDVVLLGIWGMGGIGKTTLAKAIYNRIGRNFEGRSFLANIREVWEQNVGPVDLQKQLLFDICKETKTKIQNIESGKSILKGRFFHKRVLLILDDVNTFEQLNALCGSRNWLGSGSRIIITSRDMNILRGNRVDQIYKMKEMDGSESIELFSWHAFKQASPREDFAEISRNVVEYSGGLPLALEVLGSHLFELGLAEWKCVLEKIKRIPNDQVQKKLKISYDALNDDTEKEIFLDIACFFIGMDRNDVIHILNGSELFAEIGVSVLVERSLVTVDDRNRLAMHDLLRDMGREIVREKSPKEPEERSRLWFNNDVLDVLSEQTGTKAVEGLALKLPTTDEKCFSTKAFKKMKKLRLLQLAGLQLDGDFEYLSRNVRWLSWNAFPLKCIPSSFYQGNLVSIELVNSNVKHVWEDPQRLEKLKILNLSHSHYLTQTPDFSNMPNLEQLVVTDCPKLSEVSHNIGDLKKILLINLENCIKLQSLPRSIYKLKSLQTLLLSGCLLIDKLEEDLEQMESLTTLVANNTAIKRVPFSILRLKSIGFISLCGYEGFSCEVFPAIISSWMSPTINLPFPFQTSAAMSSLISLHVTSSSSHELSSFSKQLPRLRSLCVDCNSEDQLSLDAKIILDALCATNSKELESTKTTSQESNMTTSKLIQYDNPMSVPGSKHSPKSLLIQMGTNCQVANILKEIILQNIDGNGNGGCFLPSDSYPNWLTYSSEGSSLTFEVPHVEGRNLKTMMCIVYTSTLDNVTSSGLKNMLVINYTKATIQLYKSEALFSFEHEEGQRVVSSIEPGNKVEVVFVFENDFIVKKTTVYLVYDLNAIACNDENERPVKRFSTEDEPTDDFNQKRKKKSRVE